MTGELIGRLLMVLCGFVLALLGVIVFIHTSDHYVIAILISLAGVLSMFAGLPSTESNRLNESFERNKKQMEFKFDK
jgi:uncharacterized membrane protein YgaE (UPF0421/DUF939 family)